MKIKSSVFLSLIIALLGAISVSGVTKNAAKSQDIDPQMALALLTQLSQLQDLAAAKKPQQQAKTTSKPQTVVALLRTAPSKDQVLARLQSDPALAARFSAYAAAKQARDQAAKPTTGGGQHAKPTVGGGQQAKPSAAGNQQAKPIAGGNQQAKPSAAGNQQAKPIAVGNQQAKPSAVGNQQVKPIASVNQQPKPVSTVRGPPAAPRNAKPQLDIKSEDIDPQTALALLSTYAQIKGQQQQQAPKSPAAPAIKGGKKPSDDGDGDGAPAKQKLGKLLAPVALILGGVLQQITG